VTGATRPRAVPLLFLGLLALAMLWPGRAGLPPIDRDEGRYTQATRQMLETGDWLDVRYLDQPRYVQPAGVYWLQALSVEAFGDPAVRDIWPHRLPSLVAGILAVMLTGWIGTRLFGQTAGMAGAGLFAASMLFNFEARIATTDAALLACVLAAQAGLLAVWQGRDGPRGWRAPLVFWAALGAGIMVKGPVVLLVAFGTIAALCVSERRARWLAALRPVWGVPLMLAIVLPWLVAIGIRTHGDFFARSIGHNFLGKVTQGQEAHGQPPGYYLLLFALTFWPGALLAFRALPAVWRARREAPVRFLLCWIVPTWLVFEAVATKLPHYVLPTYPAIALLAAAPLARPAARRWQVFAFGAFTAVWAIVGAALAIGMPVALWAYAGSFDPLALVLGLAGAALLARAFVMVRRDRARSAIALAVAAALLVFGNAYGRVLPHLTPFWLSPRIVALVRANRPCPDSALASTGYSEPSMVFLLGTRTNLTDVFTAARGLAADKACGLVLVGADQVALFEAQLAADGVTPRVLGSVAGVDYSNGRRLVLTLYGAAAQ
jgi:4-amino-4-deoxy-L-arabinose transferase-like glycosyltransferase